MEQEADEFRKKAEHYLVCFNDQCECRERCLRWLVGCQTDPAPVAAMSVNLRHPSLGGDHCELYRPKERVMMKRGLLHFYDNMTGRQEHDIRHQLISIYNRKVYYQMRNGRRLINPAAQQHIAAVCQQLGGFNAESGGRGDGLRRVDAVRHSRGGDGNHTLCYDGEVEDFDW